ncbi:ImmA/IrrE family metallo-endopeptidase [Lactobacillus equicursoris]|uniref:ImmA/IrrE family metallo-endopeptidase n=1 Tax=Lactobacillus equicursoris TaxID=420645 RepID=UPI0039922E8B
MISYQCHYEGEAKSRVQIRQEANELKKLLGISSSQLYIDVTRVLEEVCSYYGYDYDILEDSFFEPGEHAKTDTLNHIIKLKESVYYGAVNNNGIDRFTIAHEIYHLLKHQPHELVLYTKDYDMPIYCNPEWQAECFGAELLMPYMKIKDMTIEQIIDECEVTPSAAWYQKNHI